jgi:hypothetical protein
MVGSELFVFGGINDEKYLDDMWALDVNSCTISHRSLSHFDLIFPQ